MRSTSNRMNTNMRFKRRKTKDGAVKETIMNKQKKEVHLCEECSREKGISYKANISVQELFSHLNTQKSDAPASEASPAGAEDVQADLQTMTCPDCGISFGEFRSTGRLGCPEDYRHFKQGLTELSQVKSLI